MRTNTTRLHETEAAAVGAVTQLLPVAVAFLVGEAFLAEAGLPPDRERHQDFIQGYFGRYYVLQKLTCIMTGSWLYLIDLLARQSGVA